MAAFLGHAEHGGRKHHMAIDVIEVRPRADWVRGVPDEESNRKIRAILQHTPTLG